MAEGTCWTDDPHLAAEFADGFGADDGVVERVDLDPARVTVVEVGGYNHDENDAPADDPDFRQRHAAAGADLVRYSDETPMGSPATCWRAVRDLVPADRVEVVSL